MSDSKLEIIVGEGTCGRASGSTEIMGLFRKNAPDATIRTVGCVGMCHAEVMVEVIDGDGNSHMYGNVDKKGVTKILKFHRGEDEKPEDMLLSATDDPELEGGQYLTKQTRLALRNVGTIDPTDMEQYKARGGYSAIEKIIQTGMTPEDVIEQVKISGIRGRGGAGFPTATKWTFARGAVGDKKYLICNGDEGDPGAFMDRSLLEGDPHNILEGMLIAAYAIGASGGYAYIRAEYPLAVKNFDKAIQDATAAGYLG
ncbi:MAG: NADH-quinone oxidoreductase subunit F, partial [bacterium]|nr:NADH-quinone oxidoreductase subunit F [bacterium]